MWSNNDGCDKDNHTTRTCKICRISYKEEEACATSAYRKVVHNCKKYLHTAIVDNNFKEPIIEAPVICPQCFDSALQLTELDDQLETIQKSINDLLLTFSLMVLHRRTELTHRLPKKGTIEIDICPFPHLFNDLAESLIEESESISLNLTESENIDLVINNKDVIDTVEENDDPLSRDDFVGNEIKGLRLPLIRKTESGSFHGETGRPIRKKSLSKNSTIEAGGATKLKKNKKFLDQSSAQSKLDNSTLSANRKVIKKRPGLLTKPRKRFRCTCGKQFTAFTDYQVHRGTHTGEKAHKCPICSKTFSRRDNLLTHARIHTGEKPFECSFCTNRFLRRSDCTNHERTHTRDKPYKCTICPKAFISNPALIYHARTHMGEKPYQCHLCSNGYRYKSQLNQHMLIHSEEKLFKCSLCSKEFAQIYNLTKHIRTHTEEKTKCPHCDKRFSTAKTCATHVKREHPDFTKH